MRKIAFFVIFMLLFCLNVQAQDTYTEQYQAGKVEEIYDLLDNESAEVIDRMQIDISDADWVNKIEPENIFKEIWGFLKDGMKTPLKCGLGMLAVIILIAVAGTFEGFKPFTAAASYIFVLSALSSVLLPLFSLIEACGSAIKGVSTLMLGFIPVYTGILTVAGQGITASGMSFLMLGASGAVSNFASFAVVPLMSCYLGVGMVSSITETAGSNRLGELIKKVAMWSLSFILTVFIGILSIQTSVNAAADNLGLKTARFLIGSFIPVAGGALSESLTTFMGSMKLLKSSVGMFGVVGVGVTVLPIIIELLIWRITLFLLDAACELFGIRLKTDILKAADCVLAVLVGVLLFISALFIISLAIIAGR